MKSLISGNLVIRDLPVMFAFEFYVTLLIFCRMLLLAILGTLTPKPETGRL